jgi:Asp/Glu/hydantoin racemase
LKILLLNGNTDEAITSRLVTAARAMCAHDITGATTRFGARYIASRAAVAIAGHAVLDALAGHVGADNAAGYDAAIIACFGDPGLDAAREILPIPVLGMADASIRAALRMAPRVAVLTGGGAWVPMLDEFFTVRGLTREQVRVAAITPTGDMIARDPEGAALLLAETARAEVAAGAGAVLLGGAGLVGLDALLQPLLRVPVLCGLRATLDALPDARRVACGGRAPNVGLSPALSRCLAE